MKDRVVLVTGGGSGIGRSAARHFASEGAALALLGRDKTRLEAACAEIGETGGLALAVPADVCDCEGLAQAVRLVSERFGQIDVLVNCAGAALRAALIHETADKEWAVALDVNLGGTFRMIRAALPCMLSRGRGVIVNVASIAGMVGMSGLGAYGAAKAGVIALTRSVAVEYGKRGIRCNCVCPGTVETPMTEAFLRDPERRRACAAATTVGRVGSAEHVAAIIRFLGSDESSYLNGAVIPVDGGYIAR